MQLFGIIAVVFVLRMLIRKVFNSGPSKEQLLPFKVADGGGALQQLNKDAQGRVTLKLAKKT